MGSNDANDKPSSGAHMYVVQSCNASGILSDMSHEVTVTV